MTVLCPDALYNLHRTVDLHRKVELVNTVANLDLLQGALAVGCESGSAIVAVMSAPLQAGADANALLAGWQKATLDNVRVTRPLAAGQQQVWHRPGQLPLASSVRIQAKGLRPDGEAVLMDAVWGAVAEGDRVRLIHAVVYDRQIQPEMANTLFEGLKP